MVAAQNLRVSSRISSHEKMDILHSADHVLGLARRGHGGQSEVVVLGVQNGATHVAVGASFAIQIGWKKASNELCKFSKGTG